MAARPPRRPARRKPRRGTLERPVNGRMYRGTWLVVGIPFLLVAFTIARPLPLPPPAVPPTFDGAQARALAAELARDHPDRVPGSPRAHGAAAWFAAQLRPYGLRAEVDRFDARIPGLGRVPLENVVARVPGRSPDAVVVMAHRDNLGTSPGANDNASGTAALLELARVVVGAPGAREATVQPYTLVLLSTDGGAWGSAGAARFAAAETGREQIVAVVNLDAIAGPGRIRLVPTGDRPRSPAPTLVETASVRVLEQSGRRPTRPGLLRQLVDLGFPFSLYEQAPFVGLGVPAITLTTGRDRPDGGFGDDPARLDAARLEQVGRATQALIGSIQQGLEVDRRSGALLFLGYRVARGWAVEVALLAALLPFAAALVDLFARCRRRRVPLGPAFAALRSRVGLWLWAGLVVAAFALAGAWPEGSAHPPSPSDPAATSWAVLAVLAAGALVLAGWLVARDRLAPRRALEPEEALAGHVAALLGAGGVALVTVAVNPYALVFVLPSLHAWLWLPQVAPRGAGARLGVFALGLSGPALLAGSLAVRYGLGLDTPWYALTLASTGYFSPVSVLAAIGWAACAAQLAALATGRYAPYPAPAERGLGPLRSLLRSALVAARARRAGRGDGERDAAEL